MAGVLGGPRRPPAPPVVGLVINRRMKLDSLVQTLTYCQPKLVLTMGSTFKICYRFHTFHGVEVEVIRHLRKSESVILVIKLPGGSQVAIPEWMLIPHICDRLTYEEKPRISIEALIDLRRLIDAQCLKKAGSCAESPSGGQNAQQRKSRRLAAPAGIRGRRDLDEVARTSARTVPNLVAPSPGKRRQSRRREAE